jgi:hypothetical protein
LKLSTLVFAAFLSAFALVGCNSGDQSGASSTAVAQDSGVATLSWEAPTTTTSGQSLTDLSGYVIYYGTSESDLSQTVQLAGLGIQTYVVDNLTPGTWYFAIKAVTSAGLESSLSNIVSKTIN